ncbi:MAG: MotA/TolQ/ExbB proton channel family protein [Gemmataceae bacterium]
MGNLSKKLVALLLGLLPFSVFGLAVTGVVVSEVPALAQDEDGEPDNAEAEAVEGQDDAKGSGTESDSNPLNVLIQLFMALPEFVVGLFFLILLVLLSIALIALLVVLFLELHLSSSMPPGFVDEFTEVVNQRQFKQAFELCRNDHSFLARVLTAGMTRLQYGIEDARHACINMVDSIRAGKEQLVNYLATIGTIGPLIGLITTVYGMIRAFQKLGESERVDPSQLAGKISFALGGTFLGVGIAMVAIFFNSFFRNRLTRVTMDTANLSDDLLTQMYHNSRKTGPTGTPPTAAPASGTPAPNAPAAPARQAPPPR